MCLYLCNIYFLTVVTSVNTVRIFFKSCCKCVQSQSSPSRDSGYGSMYWGGGGKWSDLFQFLIKSLNTNASEGKALLNLKKNKGISF